MASSRLRQKPGVRQVGTNYQVTMEKMVINMTVCSISTLCNSMALNSNLLYNLNVSKNLERENPWKPTIGATVLKLVGFFCLPDLVFVESLTESTLAGPKPLKK